MSDLALVILNDYFEGWMCGLHDYFYDDIEEV